MRRQSRIALGVAAVFATAAFAGCGSSNNSTGDTTGSATAAGTETQSASGGDVKIGLITALSGPASVYSPSIKQAVELAVAEVNEAGGVNGKKVDLVIADDGTAPQKSEQEARRLVDEGVKMVVSMQTSATRPPASSVVTRAKIPFIFSWSYEGGECGKYQWFTGQIPNQWVDPAIKQLVGKGQKRWYLLGNDYLWGREMNKRIGAQVKANGGEVVGEAYVPFGTTEFQTTVSEVMDAGDDATIVTNLVGADLIGFMKQYRAAGGKQQLIGWAMDEQTLEAMGPGVGKGAQGAFDYYVTLKTPSNQAWLKRLEAKYGKDKMALPGSLTVQGYDAVRLWALAANKAGSTDPEAVSKALPEVKFADGPRGEVRFTKDHYMAMRNYVARVDDSGTRYGDIVDLGVVEPQSGCTPDKFN